MFYFCLEGKGASVFIMPARLNTVIAIRPNEHTDMFFSTIDPARPYTSEHIRAAPMMNRK